MHVPPPPTLKERLQKLFGPIIAVVAGALKLGAVIFKIKFLGLAISMLVSVAGYTVLFGWTFAVGLVLLVLVHETGHLVVMRARGYTTGLPVFVPFFGAYVKGHKHGATPYDSAWASLSGPIFGGAAALAVLGLGDVYSSEFLNALGYFGLYLNLLNLAPVWQLDGAVPGAALSRVEWGLLLVVLLGVELQQASPVLPLLIIAGGYRVYKTTRHGPDPEMARLTPEQRATVVVTYLLIIAISLLGMHGHQPLARHL
jgi:Zn-dependent protease